MSDTFRLCVAGPRDAASIGAVLAASYPALMREAYDAAVLAPALRLMVRPNPRLLASGTYYIAADAGGKVVGCGGWTLARPDTGEIETGLAHLRHFASHPDWTGRGVGRALYERCAVDARAGGVRRFECYSSLNAEAFYAALGFRRVRKIALPMGPELSLDSIVMRRNL